MKTLDVSNNKDLEAPPKELLRKTQINKLLLVGCNVDKVTLMREMNLNGVKEYQDRHARKLDQAVSNNLKVDYKIFGLN